MPPFMRKRLSESTPHDLRERAKEARGMAYTASTVKVRASLLRLAERYEQRAHDYDHDQFPFDHDQRLH